MNIQSYIILCGGLGSSEYLRQCLDAKFSGNYRPNAANVIVLSSEEPSVEFMPNPRGLDMLT